MPKKLGTYLVKLSDHITEKDHGIFFKLAKVVFLEASMQVYNFCIPSKSISCYALKYSVS
jgi:hypothetical protein